MKKKKSKIYKFFFILIILIFSCSINKTADNSQDEPLSIPSMALSSDDYSINYSINDDWGSGFVVEVIIANNSSSPINDWILTWTFSGNQKITNAWNCDLSQSGNAVSVKGVPHNKNIPANGNINFGFQGVYSGINDNPADFALDAESSSSSSVSSSSSSSLSVSSSSISSSSSSSTTSSSSSSTGGIVIDYVLDNDWGTGSVVKLTITNNSTSNVSDWTLEWDFPGNQTLSGHWNAAIIQTENHVTATPASHTKNIPIGSSVEFGFQYTYSGSNEKPESFTFNGNQTSSSSTSSSLSSSSSSSSSISSSSSTSSSTSNTLRELADNNNLIFGAAISPSNMNESNYTDTLKNEFNCIVAGNDMKFSYLEPSENVFTYSTADGLVDFANSNSMKVRGHTLIWHSDYQVPQWIKDKPYSELEAAVENHVDNIMTHYKNQIYAWDVANEIAIDDGSGLRNRTLSGGNYSVWASSLTDDSVIRAAFYQADATRKANNDPVKLFLCDYSIEEKGGAKADKVFQIVEQWVSDGVPIDGIAFQCHFMEKYTPNYANIKANIDRYQAIGIEVQFTEVDVRIEEPFTEAKLNNQATIYGELIQIVLDKGINTFVIWGVSDKDSWVPSTFPGYGSPLIFDDNYNKKPAYYAIQNKLSN